MLSEGQAWRRPLAVVLALAVAAALCWLAWAKFGDHAGAGNTRQAGAPAPTVEAPTAAAPERQGDPAARDRLEAALRRGVAAAAALGGRAEAAAMLGDWERPLVATAGPDGPRQVRMWSISKVATMIALLGLNGWGERPGRPLPSEVDAALEGTIVRSENCRQRRVVLELQRRAGGPAAARAALAGVLTTAGAEARVGSQIELPESICFPYLETQTEIDDPFVPALLLGTSTWGVEDAVRFVHSLGEGAYGKALSARVLGLMRQPKRPSREVQEGELTAPLDWGAGRALAGLSPAYKAGWGGALDGDFMAGQIAVATLPGGGHLAVAAFFRPEAQPPRDDPGITAAPDAIETIMRALREEGIK